MAAIDDFKRFVADAETGTQYAKWAQQNPGELDRWSAFKNAVLGGQSPLPPTMTSAHGRELVDAAVETEHYRALEQAPAPTPTPTPTPSPSPVPAPASLPVGGFSPGNMFQTGAAIFDREMQQYIDAAAGHRMMLRIDHEDTIQACINKGFDVCLVVGATFSWASIPGGSVAAYASMCAGVAARWKGVRGLNGARLAILEVGGNEPNRNGITPTQERDLIRAARVAVRGADADLLVCNGGLAPGKSGDPSSDPINYFKAMGLAPGDIDGYQGHLYEDPFARGTWNTWDQTFAYGTYAAGTTIREVLDKAGMTGVFIMSGESGRADASDVVVANAFAEFKRRRSAGEPIGPLLIFTMRADWRSVKPGVDMGFAMLNLDWTRRPAWTAAQTGIAG